MWGLGHSLNFKSRYSTLDRRASLSYLAPRYRNVEGRNISFTALYDNTRDVRTFTAQRYEGSVQLSQRFSKATTGSMALHVARCGGGQEHAEDRSRSDPARCRKPRASA